MGDPAASRSSTGALRAALRRLRGLAALLLLVAAATPACAAPDDPTVVLISLDGTHPADLDATDLPALARMAREGARAGRMVPEFPTTTFPNHVTLVTGVSPERHGIVNNVFVDPERGEYRYAADPTWLEAEPLWSIVEGHGLLTASFHWVGSEGPWRSGRAPRYWKPFSADTPEAEKVDAILAWLALPAARRPRLVTAWFHGADGAAHRHGPRAEPVLATLREQDAELGRLLAGLDAARAWDQTTLLVVSDHGMAPVGRTVDLASALERAGIPVRVHGGGGFVTVMLERPAERERALVAARALGLEAWARGQGPAGLEARHPRFGDLVVLAPPGTAISSDGLLGRLRSAFAGGSHGHRPSEPSMSAIFLALGRGVVPGGRPREVRARDVAPTVLALLGLPVPEAMEGRPIALATRRAQEETAK
jgi:predicted AlkP superfamily pyrophosphatase or phosphodiesterase